MSTSAHVGNTSRSPSSCDDDRLQQRDEATLAESNDPPPPIVREANQSHDHEQLSSNVNEDDRLTHRQHPTLDAESLGNNHIGHNESSTTKAASPHSPAGHEAFGSVDDPEIPDKPPHDVDERSQRDHRGFWQNWWAEMIFLILMFGSFAAIIAVIAPYQHRRLPSWPYSITINALIAIFTVILRGSILFIAAKTLSQQKWIWFGSHRARPLIDMSRFDNASRGPWGSFLLVGTLYGRSTLATLGAAIIILTIAIDPFAQQVVHYYSCNLPSTSTNATMPRTGLFQETGSTRLRVNANTITAGLASAINAGVFSANAAMQITSACPSGNCRFSDPYHTVGYCSNCSDISDQVKVTNFDVPVTFLNQTTITQGLNTSLSSGYYTEYATSTNATLMVAGVLDPSVIAPGTNAPNPFELVHEKDFQVLYGAYKDDPNSYVVHPTCSNVEKSDPRTSWGCRGYGAAQCSLVPCIRTYTAEVSNGTVHENLISTSRDWGYSYRVSKASVYVPCLSTQQRSALLREGYPITPSTVWLPYDHNIDPQSGMWERNASYGINQFATDIVPPRCLYEFFFIAITSINEYLQEHIFNGTVTAYGSDTYAAYTSTNPVITAMYNEGNVSFPFIESTFENISLAMTSYIRQHSNSTWSVFNVNSTSPSLEPNFLAQGTILEDDTCVEVRWPWLILPGTLAVLTAIFLCATIIETSLVASRPRRRNVALKNENNTSGLDGSGTVEEGSRSWSSGRRHAAVWKESLLPLLYHGLDEKLVAEHDASTLTPIHELERLAKTLNVRMSKAENGWKFVKVD